ncbi:Cupredoxin [Lipomyces japonicus]|uniref:Cupredoxin n=1 Tax=Lipomyces japonicus TaxID=56871 RepID=UPI0034CD9398
MPLAMSEEQERISARPDAEKPRSPTETSGRADLIIVTTALLVVFAIALGLGIGFRTYHQPSLSASGNNGGSQSLNDDWRLDTSTAYSISSNWNSSAPKTTREYNFTISNVVGWPDGFNRTLTVINGQFPGPMIEANMGDRIVINVVNEGDIPTTLHWHGLYQNGTNFMDGVANINQCPIPPGKSMIYNFTVQDQYGTYWYHSHYKTQYMDGVIGPLIIHSEEEDLLIGDLYDYDQVILLTDWYHGMSDSYIDAYLTPGNENTEPVPDNGLINGANYFNCSLTPYDTCYQDEANRAMFNVQQNKTYRFRVINTGAFAEIDFSVDDHVLTLIEGDGTLIKPTEIHKLQVSVAQRYSVLLHTNISTAAESTEIFYVRAELDQFCFATDNPLLDPGVKGYLVYNNSQREDESQKISEFINNPSNSWNDVAANVRCKDLNNTAIEPLISETPPNATHFYRLDSAFLIKAYQRDRAYINGTTWYSPDVSILYQALQMFQLATDFELDNNNVTTLMTTSGVLPLGVFSGDQNQYIINVNKENSVIDILINNLDDGSHPFHLHGYKFWVLGSGLGNFDYKQYGSVVSNATNPMKRDTLQVVSYGWALIRFVADNPGLWPFHCHITWHLEAGLFMQFQILPEKIAQFDPPVDWTELCAA